MRLYSPTQKGFALVLVLWILSLLTIMAGSFALSMRRETAIIEGVKYNAESQTIAESAFALAQLMLLNPDEKSRWRADGSIYQIDFADAQVRLRLLSETGKIDINVANPKLLTALMTHAPAESKQQTQLLSAMLDWRDADESVREEGAEKAEYKHAKLSYGPRNKRFRSTEELQLVLGMNGEIFKWIKPLITVFSGQAVDIRLAAREVLEVLPEIDASKINEYLQARQQSVLNGTPAPAFPMNGAELNEVDKSTSELQNEEIDSGDDEGEDVDTGVVEMIAEVKTDTGTNTMFSVVVEKSDTGVGSPFKVLKWHRDYASDVSLFADEMSELLVGQYAEPQFNN